MQNRVKILHIGGDIIHQIIQKPNVSASYLRHTPTPLHRGRDLWTVPNHP